MFSSSLFSWNRRNMVLDVLNVTTVYILAYATLGKGYRVVIRRVNSALTFIPRWQVSPKYRKPQFLFTRMYTRANATRALSIRVLNIENSLRTV